MGILPQPRSARREDQRPDAAMETTGVVLDEPLQCMAVFGRISVRAVRLQRRAVLPELLRSARRELAEPRASVALRRARPPAMERGVAFIDDLVGAQQRGTRFRRMDRADAVVRIKKRR